MSKDWYQDSIELVKGLGQYVGEFPHWPPKEVRQLRVSLIEEEFEETITAIEQGNMEETIDGIADCIVVLLGTAVSMGVDIRPIWDAVHKSNMEKCGGPKREDGKSLKPEGWEHPDIHKLIMKQIRKYKKETNNGSN